MNDFIRMLAAWALVHESADEGWKAAVSRGYAQGRTPGAIDAAAEAGPEAFVDGLAALVAEEKEKLKASLAGDGLGRAPTTADIGGKLDVLGFELAELRGRIESLQASVDAIAARGKE
jgi:hypothetical protein